jgi:hypothetical protein
MDDYGGLWQAIQRSPFIGVYISELYWLAKQVEEDTTRIFDDTPRPPRPGEGYIRVDHELHGRILAVLLAAARIRALLRPRSRDGPRAQREVLTHRTAALRQVLDGIDLAPVLDGAARNSIERFDEYVDEAAIQSYRGVIPRPTLFAVDMVLSTRSVLRQFDVGRERPTTYFIRAYIADERVFSNCGRELRLEPLRDCCSTIRQRVEPLLPDFAREERGGSMLVVTANSFSREGGLDS